MAQGGRARNVIPAYVELNLNHRFGPETTLDESAQKLRELVGTAAEVAIVDRSPAAPPQKHHPFVTAWLDAGVRSVVPKLGHTDVAQFFAANVRAVNFGPGTVSQAHQANEWASFDELVLGRSILDRWLVLIGR